MSKPVILTGLRANNELTLGNYLGALLPLIDMARTKSDEYDVNLFVPDLHSFTTPIDHGKLYQRTLDNLRVYVAAGLPLDNPSVHIYRQSYVPAHSELTWILDCFTGFGEMSRMIQFKDKSRKLYSENSQIYNGEMSGENHEWDAMQVKKEKLLESLDKRISIGLFNYPVLMAADILLYGAKYVPVGEDQAQHLEFARDIAERINKQFGEIFVVPEPVPKQHEFFGKDQGLRIRDLQDPAKKMSKSDETGKGVIFLSDTPQIASKKVMSAATDSFGEIKYDIKERPGVTNLLQILALLSHKSQAAVNKEWEGQTSYGDLKKAVTETVATFLTQFQARLVTVDTNALQTKLASDESKMCEVASQTLEHVQRAVGLRPA